MCLLGSKIGLDKIIWGLKFHEKYVMQWYVIPIAFPLYQVFL